MSPGCGQRTPGPVRRALLGATAALALAFVPSVTVAGPAAAHTDLVGTTPADGESLEVAPDELRIDFSEALVPALTDVVVREASGEVVRTASPAVFGGSLGVGLPALDRGGYRVEFRVVGQDGHPVAGELEFRVRTVDAFSAAGPAQAAAPAASLASTSAGTMLDGPAGWLAGAGLVALVLVLGRLAVPYLGMRP